MEKYDIMHAWLRGDDNVMKATANGRDSRTWGGLIAALESEDHGGVAKKVKEVMFYYCAHGPWYNLHNM